MGSIIYEEENNLQIEVNNYYGTFHDFSFKEISENSIFASMLLNNHQQENMWNHHL